MANATVELDITVSLIELGHHSVLAPCRNNRYEFDKAINAHFPHRRRAGMSDKVWSEAHFIAGLGLHHRVAGGSKNWKPVYH
ncbi:MAG: hypothetical protein OXE85_04835 [Roseovarius sp.]|nr:hypothetical protein [Roseovarius sp.]